MNQSASYLHKIQSFFKENSDKNENYLVPNLWLHSSNNQDFSKVNYNEFYLQKINEILENQETEFYNQSLSKIRNEHHGIGGDWSYHSVVYNCMPRLTTAFDHNNSGDLNDFEVHGKVYRKTGTFLKMIAILPYIKDLGCNVLHVLPITQIGLNGRKGDLGSPYAIKNPLALDENLAEPGIPFSVDEQFMALVEACHRMGIRIVLEFVMRTASLDSDWIRDHPDWFYWIKKDKENLYSKPEFTLEELKKIKENPGKCKTHIPPNKEFQEIFAEAPEKEEVNFRNKHYYAHTKNGELIIPSAFADWPPDDKQPPWEDVTYLKLFKDEFTRQNYNYISYNTIRYYDEELTKPENRNIELWNAISDIIPYYQKTFGIDGVMLDMGHALPEELLKLIVEKARNEDSDFCFWEENFEILKSSRNNGFNATLGFEWKYNEHAIGIRNIMLNAKKALPLPFFGTPETHNTPRLINQKIKEQYWILNCFMPSCLPYIHSGHELNEIHPVNTGLNFSDKEMDYYKDFPLALFNRQALDWTGSNEFLSFMQTISKLRIKNAEWIATGDERTLNILYPENRFGKVLAFERHDAFQPWKTILVLMNTNLDEPESFFLRNFGTYDNKYIEFISGDLFSFVNHWISGELKPGQSLIFEIHKLI